MVNGRPGPRLGTQHTIMGLTWGGSISAKLCRTSGCVLVESTRAETAAGRTALDCYCVWTVPDWPHGWDDGMQTSSEGSTLSRWKYLG